jgi:heat shock protein HtpX
MRRYYNGIKTAALLGLLTSLILVLGYSVGGTAGLVIAALVSLAVNATSYFYSDKIALRAMRARPLSRVQAPQLYAMVAELAAEAGQPMPRLYLSPARQPNAFATGRSPRAAAVCVTKGALDLLSARELRAVLGHELAHVYNRDILISSVAAALAGIITTLAELAWFVPLGSTSDDEDSGPGVLGWLLMLIFGPVAAALIRLAISRSREFAADADGAVLSGDPLALASALRKIHDGTRMIPLPADGRLASTAHLMIANPLRGDGIAALFSTHPPMGERVARLQEMAAARLAYR